jgi:hypothetical protein
MWGALSDERTGLSVTIAAGPRLHILLFQIRDFPFRRLLRLAGLRWRYSTPPPHECTAFYKMPKNLIGITASKSFITAVHVCVLPETPVIPW